MGVWVCGCVGVWVCGCVGVWVCGCDYHKKKKKKKKVWVCGKMKKKLLLTISKCHTILLQFLFSFIIGAQGSLKIKFQDFNLLEFFKNVSLNGGGVVEIRVWS